MAPCKIVSEMKNWLASLPVVPLHVKDCCRWCCLVAIISAPATTTAAASTIRPIGVVVVTKPGTVTTILACLVALCSGSVTAAEPSEPTAILGSLAHLLRVTGVCTEALLV